MSKFPKFSLSALAPCCNTSLSTLVNRQIAQPVDSTSPYPLSSNHHSGMPALSVRQGTLTLRPAQQRRCGLRQLIWIIKEKRGRNHLLQIFWGKHFRAWTVQTATSASTPHLSLSMGRHGEWRSVSPNLHCSLRALLLPGHGGHLSFPCLLSLPWPYPIKLSEK